MSVRRAIELNFKNRLEAALANTKYKVVESLNTDERPMPCVVVIAGDASNPFEGIAAADGNYSVDLSILVMTNIDTGSVDEHNDAVQLAFSLMATQDYRKKSVVDGLYLYDVVKQSSGDRNQDRKIGAGMNFRVVCNYSPATPAA